ncbi:MAG: bifunctional DNA-formamidopyrimidine glycosylase/DNA-(apurinic or apyrimidinic site) lyase [Pseudomonadota bacterium]
MPELPEVETVCRGLAPAMEGETFLDVIQNRPDLRFPFPERFVARINGSRLTHIRRRAKYICAHLSTGDVLIMHLGMSGRFTIEPPTGTAQKPGEYVYSTDTIPAHDHVVFRMSSGAVVTYNDPRRFGFMDLVPEDELDSCKHFAGMGVEPLGNALNAEYLAGRAHRRSTDLKAFLLDQRNIAGLGNIYVCEALYRAGLSPKRKASCLALASGMPSDRNQRLVPIIRDVLNEAIAAGGSTLRDYAAADGSLGYFQHTFRVYGREREACLTPGCDSKVRRIVQAGRSTFYCSACQR